MGTRLKGAVSEERAGPREGCTNTGWNRRGPKSFQQPNSLCNRHKSHEGAGERQERNYLVLIGGSGGQNLLEGIKVDNFPGFQPCVFSSLQAM